MTHLRPWALLGLLLGLTGCVGPGLEPPFDDDGDLGGTGGRPPTAAGGDGDQGGDGDAAGTGGAPSDPDADADAGVEQDAGDAP